MFDRAAGIALLLAVVAAPAFAGPVPRERVEAAVARIDAMAADLVAAGEVPGLAIGVVHDDAVVWTKGFGLRRAGSAEAVDPDTVFQLASMSKPISATVVAALVGEGVVGWDDRIRDLDPGFALRDPYPTAEVTVRDLFNHRSGLPGSAGNDLEQIGFDRATVMHRLRLAPASSSFRSGYSYSNAGFTAGALAAVRPTGRDWETVAAETLFAPLGMTASSFRYRDFEGRANAAALHVRQQDSWTPLVTYDPFAQAPAGAATSSVRDLTRWMRLELGEGEIDGTRLIEPTALAATHVPLMARGDNPVTGAPSFYGLGWNVEYGRHGLAWGHAGAFSYGARTVVTLLPESRLGIVVLANAFPTGVPEAVADSFLDLAIDGDLARDYLGPWNAIYASLFEPAVAEAKARFATPPQPATPARPPEAYAGRYTNAYVGDALVEAGPDGALTLILGPGGAKRLPMTHFDRDLFVVFPDAEMPDRPSAAHFGIAADGRADTITIESLDANGLGTLARADRP